MLTSCSSNKGGTEENLKNSSEDKKTIKIGCMQITEPIIEYLAEGLEKVLKRDFLDHAFNRHRFEPK